MTAQPALPIVRVVSHARQQLAGTRGVDDQFHPLNRRRYQLRIERDEDVHPGAVVRIGGGEDAGAASIPRWNWYSAIWTAYCG